MFLYTNSKLFKKEIKKTTPFTIAKATKTYLEMHSAKEVEDLDTENYKTLMKEMKEDTDKWKNIPCSWFGRINIVKIST